MLIPLTQANRDPRVRRLRGATTFPKTLRGGSAIRFADEQACVRVRTDGQKAFAARFVEAAGIGRLKAVHYSIVMLF